jgi:hypothetical protein
MSPHGRITAKREIEQMLAGSPSLRSLRYRLASVERLRADIVRLVCWPALADSLAADAARLRAELQRRTAA